MTEFQLLLRVLPIDVCEIILSYGGETKIEKRKFYHLLTKIIRSFGIESIKIRFSNKYKKIIGIRSFIPLANEMDRYMRQYPSEIISEYTNRMLEEKGERLVKITINMFEYITLTKDGRDMMINNKVMLEGFVLKFKLRPVYCDFKITTQDNSDVKERMGVYEKMVFYKKIHKSEYFSYFDKDQFDEGYIRQTLMLREIPGIDNKSTKAKMQQLSIPYITE